MQRIGFGSQPLTRVWFLSVAIGIIERMFDTEFDGIPAGLDRMEPGPALAAFLASIEGGNLSGRARVVVLRAHQKMASHYQAHIYGDMAAVSDAISQYDDIDDFELVAEAAAAEIRVALRLTRRAADTELAFALDLRDRLPRVFDHLIAGDLDVRRARTIGYGTSHLDSETARLVVERIIDLAPQLTTGQLGACIRKLCIEVDPDEAKERFEDAIEGRRLVIEPTESGTAHLQGFDLPPDRAAAAAARINQIARSLRTSDETRTIDQLRADVYLDLLTGTKQSAGVGGVEIQVDLNTLAGLADHPGELAGYGPVIADIARQIADRQHATQWRYVVTDPTTGQPLHTGLARRRPTAAQRRQVETGNPTCVFPGCRMPAGNCDLDHRTPYAEGGPTEPDNLTPLCRHDHRLRHQAGWTHQQLPNGDHQWTTKLGHTYTTGGAEP